MDYRNAIRMGNAALMEGVNDPYIFKAIFTAGGPGSGKSFMSGHMVRGLGLKFVNSDIAFERLLRKASLPMKISKDDEETYSRQMDVRTKAKMLTNKRQAGWIQGMLGLLIDGTGKDYSKITLMAKKLKDIGYDVGMIFVNTSLEIAIERNRKRNRTVPEDLVRKSWNAVQSNMGKFQDFFKQGNFFIVDSNKTYEGADLDSLSLGLRRSGMKWLKKPIVNRIGVEKLRKIREVGGKTLLDL